MTNRQLWVAYSGIVRREVVRFMRIWGQTLLPSAITMALYFLIFGQVIGAMVGEVHGVSYALYIMPGLVMMSVIMNSYANVVGSFYGLRFSRAVEELLVSPMPHYLIIAGFMSGGIARGFVVGLIAWLTSLYFTGFHIAHVFLALLTLFMCSALFSLAGFLNAMFARKFDDTAIVPTFILTPLIYLGGVFYSTEHLNNFWQFFVRIDPIHYIIELGRYAVLGHSTGTSWWASLAIITLLAVGLFGTCLYCFNKGYGLKS